MQTLLGARDAYLEKRTANVQIFSSFAHWKSKRAVKTSKDRKKTQIGNLRKSQTLQRESLPQRWASRRVIRPRINEKHVLMLGTRMRSLPVSKPSATLCVTSSKLRARTSRDLHLFAALFSRFLSLREFFGTFIDFILSLLFLALLTVL